MNGETANPDAWISERTALVVMVTLFIALGITTADAPMTWWMRVLSSVITGGWLSGWFYDRLTSEETPCSRFGSTLRFVLMASTVAVACGLAQMNVAGVHSAILIGMAGIVALARRRSSIADFLGLGAFALTVATAILA